MSKIYFKAGNRKEKIYRWIILLLAIVLVGGANWLKWQHPEMTNTEFSQWLVAHGGVWYFFGFLALMIFLWFQANKTGIRKTIEESKKKNNG